MSGTGASNLGYGQVAPLSNINGKFVNIDNSHSAGGFGSTQIPGLPGLAGAKSNIDAAAGKAPGICLFKGGAKVLKRKIKNITKMYKKMKKGSRKMKSLKKRIRSRKIARHVARTAKFAGGRKRIRTCRQRGGYSQYQNNQPFSMGYSTGGVLSASQSALANPVPFKPYNSAIDNYKHYTNTGFPSRGH